MSGVIKNVQADAAQVQATAAADLAKAEAAVRGAVGTAQADVGKYANQATIGVQKDVAQAQGWLRHYVWGILGAAVVLALVVFWFVVR